MWQYETTVVWKAGKEGGLHAGGNPDVCVAPPPDFGGPYNHWSPEQNVDGCSRCVPDDLCLALP